MVTTRDTTTKKNLVSIFLKRSLIARTMKVGEEYMLTSIDPDNAKELREWYDVLSSVVRIFANYANRSFANASCNSVYLAT